MKKFFVAALAAGLCLPFAIGAQEKKPQDPEAVFKRLDRNGDGKLSKEEFVGNLEGEKKSKKENRFAQLDKNNDGFLSLEEFKAGMTKKKN